MSSVPALGGTSRFYMQLVCFRYRQCRCVQLSPQANNGDRSKRVHLPWEPAIWHQMAKQRLQPYNWPIVQLTKYKDRKPKIATDPLAHTQTNAYEHANIYCSVQHEIDFVPLSAFFAVEHWIPQPAKWPQKVNSHYEMHTSLRWHRYM